MPTAIAMPKLGIKMEEGTVLEWLVSVGDAVEKGQIILIFESDKAETELEAPAAGVLRHIYIEPDTTVPCGSFLAVLTDGGGDELDAEGFRSSEETVEAVAAPAAPVALPPPPGATPSAPRASGKSPVTPAARKRARELEVDPEAVPGTGPGGRVTREDVDAYAELMAARVEVAPGLSLEVGVEGEGTPVVLLPGFGSDASAFARQTPVLAEGYAVLAVNARGVGVSDAPEDEVYAVEAAATDVAALLDEPGHIVGASLGSAVALELALTAPEKVRSLTLITPFVEARPRLLAVLDAWCKLGAGASAETLASALVPWLFSSHTLGDARAQQRAIRGLAEMSRRVSAATLERSAAGLRAWSGTRADALGKIAAPTLVIAAADDLLTPEAAEIARAIPDARLVEVPNAGHAVALESADEVNRALVAHLGAA